MPEVGLVFDLAQLRLKRVLRGVLQGRIECRVNGKPAVIHLILRQDQAQGALHSVHRIVLLDLWHPLRMGDDFCFFGLLGL